MLLAIAALPIAVLSAESLAWWWNNPPEPEEGRSLLTYTFPPDSDVSISVEVADTVMDILSCDNGQSGWLDGGGGRKLSVNYFEWNNTDKSGLSHVFGHQPEVCMGNLGKKVQAYLESRSHKIDGHDLVFDATEFRDEKDKPLYIFKLGWAEGMEGMNLLRDVPGSGDSLRSFKVKSVLGRWFPRHARVLMIGVYGASSDQEAWELLDRKVLKDVALRNIKS